MLPYDRSVVLPDGSLASPALLSSVVYTKPPRSLVFEPS